MHIPKVVSLVLILVVIFISSTGIVQAQAGVIIVDQPPEISFPESITFNAEIRGDSAPKSVILEYGVDQLTCGTVIAHAFPEVTPKNSNAKATWTWEMLQSGALPPGAQVWWRWIVTTQEGSEITSEQHVVTWLDDIHNWRNIESGGLTLHWYEGSKSFAQSLHTAATDAIHKLEKDAGLVSSGQVHIYIYGTPSDMRDALLYEPGWTGGVAFSENNITIIGVSPDQVDWGKSTIAHELTHVLAGRSTFSCLQSIPTWLVEGLAMYSEGQLEPSSQAQLDDAIRTDKLIPLRALSGGFSEEADKADLSYSQSYSVVTFLIEKEGRDKLQQLLKSLSDAETIDNALTNVYGYNVDGLEKVWRQNIGARPRTQEGEPTPTVDPTLVPTIRPVSASSISASTPTIRPTSGPEATATPQARVTQQTPDNSGAMPLPVILVIVCVVLFLAGIGGAIFIGSRLPKKKEVNDETY